MPRRSARGLAGALVLSLAVSPTVALFPQAALAAPRGSDLDPALREGQQHFRRGLELYEEGDLDGAHAELTRAYEIAPSYKILYNLGQISLRRQDWVAAERELRAYLVEGKNAVPGVPASRRREVTDTLARLSERSASVEITADRPGAYIKVDEGNEVALPLAEPLRLKVGHHLVAILWPSGERESKAVDLAGGDRESLHFAAPLAPPPLEGVVPLETWASRPPGLPPALPRVPPESSPSTSLLARDRPAKGQETQASSEGNAAWVSWTATALFAAATGVTGVMALRSSRTLADERASYPVDADALSRTSTRTRHLSLAADGLGAATVLLGGLSLYFTFRSN